MTEHTEPTVIDVPPALPAPDWYPDPLSADHHRWWSGIAWTGFTQLVVQAPPSEAEVEIAPEAAPAAPRARGRRALPLDEAAELAAIAAAAAAVAVAHPVEPEPEPEPDPDPEPEPHAVLELDVVDPEPVPALDLDLEPAPEPDRVLVAAAVAVPTIATLQPDPARAPTRTAAATAVAVQRYVPAPPAANVPGRVAVGLAIAGILAGVGVLVVPVLLPVSILLLLIAIVVAVSALPRWGRRRGVAVVGLVLGVAGLAVGPLVLGQVGFQQVIAGELAPLGIDVSLAGERSAAVGEQVVLGDGIAVTVQGVDCGVSRVIGASGAAMTADGEYCIVRANILNGSEMPIVVRAEDVAVSVGGVDYPASPTASDLGGAVSPTSVDPATGIEASFVVDVPAGSSADGVELDATWADGPTLRVAAGG